MPETGLLLLLWTVLAVLFGTSAISVRAASRTRLTAILHSRGKGRRAREFFIHQRAYARAALVCHILSAMLFVATLFHSVGPTDPWYQGFAAVLGLGLGWLLLFGVGIPVGWARYAGDAFLARALLPLGAVRRLLHPLLMIVAGVDEVVRRLAGAPDETQDAEQIEREIMDIVSRGETSGAVDASERAMIKSVMELDEIDVGKIMTPRTDICAIEIESDYSAMLALVRSCGHSRIPVFEATLDHVIGILYAKDLLRVENPETFSLRRSMRPPHFVPETKDLSSLLREFQAGRVHIAIVLDEYGGTAGLVTIEDILEELVGEIADEHDEAPPAPPIAQLNERLAEVDARVRIEELNEALQLSLPEGDSYDTVGGYVFSKLGRIPSTGESFLDGGVRIEILQARERAIDRIRVHRLNAVAQE